MSQKSQARKKLGELYRLDQYSAELFEVTKVEEIDDGDLVTFRSTKTLSIRVVDEFKGPVLPFQGPEISYETPPEAALFERTHIYFSKRTQKIGVTGDQIEYFRDTRNGKTYIVAHNSDKQVYQVARFKNLRSDERSRMPSEQTYDEIENVFLLKNDKLDDLPFMLGWVKCWGLDDDLPNDFNWSLLPPVSASDGAAVLAALDKMGKL